MEVGMVGLWTTIAVCAGRIAGTGVEVAIARALDTFCAVCCLDNNIRLKVQAMPITTSSPAQPMESGQQDRRRLRERDAAAYIHISEHNKLDNTLLSMSMGNSPGRNWDGALKHKDV